MDVSKWLIDEDHIAYTFKETKTILEAYNKTIFVDWIRPVLEEVNANVTRSLLRKFSACDDGFKAAKIAGIYAFWIAKLKPMFTIITNFRTLNEYVGLMVGIAYVKERLGIDIKLEREELLEMCDTLRYHTSSPHTMIHIFTLWIERQKLKGVA